MVNILYISSASEDTYNNRNRITSSSYSVAAVKYAELINKGFKSQILSDRSYFHIVVPPVAPYPSFKKLFFSKAVSEDKRLYIPFCNVTILKQFSQLIALLFYILKWYNTHPGQKRIVFSSIQLVFLLAAIPFKLGKRIKTISFVPDVPQFQYSYTTEKSRLKRLFTPLYISLCKQLYRSLDGFVFITEYMKELFPSRPYYIMEGITDLFEEKGEIDSMNRKHDNFILMYAGSLYEQMGINKLVDAITSINNDKIELWLFGIGDSVPYIVNASKTDPKIIYKGAVDNKTVIEAEREVDLLVNPRPTENLYTKYSFPSKTIEYMQSGTPLLTTHLAGIPKEYDEFLYYIEDESVEGIRNAICKCVKISREEMKEKGERAKTFVQCNKNYKTQISKILNGSLFS